MINNENGSKDPLTQKDPQSQGAEGEKTTKEHVSQYKEVQELIKCLDAVYKCPGIIENALFERDTALKQTMDELAETKQQLKKTKGLLTETKTQLMERNKEVLETESLLTYTKTVNGKKQRGSGERDSSN